MDRDFLLKTYGRCYDAEAGPWNLSLQNKYLEFAITRFFEENFPIPRVAALCNIGIGAGYWDRYLSYRLDGGTLTSIDIQEICCRQLEECLANERNPNPVRVICSDVMLLDGLADSFDIVTMVGSARMESGLREDFLAFCREKSVLDTGIAPQAEDVIGELANRMNAMIHRVKPDRSDLDMVFEVMLKLGVPLDFPVTEVSVNGKTAYSVGEDCLLLVCLTPDIQPEDMEQMAEYAPKAVISRDSFTDDTAMANAWYILRDRGVDLKLV